MNAFLKKLLLLGFCAALLANMGCTTTVTAHGSPEALAEKKIRAGAKVTLHYVSGHSEKAKLTGIGDESVSAVTEDGRTIEVAYADLLSLDHKKIDVLKTTGAAVGTVALTAVVVGALAVGTMAAVAGGG